MESIMGLSDFTTPAVNQAIEEFEQPKGKAQSLPQKL
jgi:hypothetical protein